MQKILYFSFACHKLSNIIKYKNYDFEIVFLSPIFTTTSHPKVGTVGILNLAKARKINPQIFALGGVNKDNIQSLTKLKIKGFEQ